MPNARVFEPGGSQVGGWLISAVELFVGNDEVNHCSFTVAHNNFFSPRSGELRRRVAEFCAQ